MEKTNTQGDQPFNFVNILYFLIKWKYTLLVSAILGGIISFVIASPPITYPRFKSEAIFYPATTNSISRAVLDEGSYSRDKDFLAFGEEEEAEQVLQLLQSSEVINATKERFNLLEHYDIDTEKRFAQTKFRKKFDKNVSFDRTRYLSIKITVLDEHPDTAANMANFMMDYVDSLKTNIQRKRALQALDISREAYLGKRTQINEMVDSLKAIGKFGVLNYEQQASALTEGLITARIQGLSQMEEQFQEQFDALAQYGPIHQNLLESMIYELDELRELRKRYDQLKVDASEKLSNIFVVETAHPAERKTTPKRSIVVLVSMVLSVVFAIAFLIFRKHYLAAIGRFRKEQAPKS